MSYRALIWASLALGIAVSCSGDPPKKVVRDQEAGAGGEAGEPALGSGGSDVTPQAGMPGVTAGSGGDAPEPEVGGAGGGGEPVVPSEGGSGGAPVLVPGEGGAGGDANPPTGSVCGEGQYDAYETGCEPCPALPNPNYPTLISCQDYYGSYYDSQSHTLRLRFDTEIHEALSGQVSVTWTDDDNSTGSGQYDWSFDPQAPNTFDIVMPDAPTTAQAFQISDFIFTDACGFVFNAPSIPIEWFVETWSCGGPVSSCGSGNYDNGDGCSTCPGNPPVDPIALGCTGTFQAANFNSYDNWLDISFDAGIHEAFSGEAHILWQDDQQVTGEGDFGWSYDPSSNNFRFYVGDTIPDNAQDFRIEGWSFTDACGYQFEGANPIRISYVGEGYDIDCGS